jgi:hypothetical protein
VAGTESPTSITGPGPKGGFYFVNESGAAEEVGTQQFLGADLSAPEERGMPLQASHNATVRAAGYAFDDEHLRKVRAQGAKQLELTHTQTYVLTELRRIHGELGSEDWGEKAERLEEVCRFEVSTVVRRELNAAHRAALRK